MSANGSKTQISSWHPTTQSTSKTHLKTRPCVLSNPPGTQLGGYRSLTERSEDDSRRLGLKGQTGIIQREGEATATGRVTHPTLMRGSTGPAVQELQTKLNTHGATPPLAVDGIFGPLTQAAVIQFQQTHQDSSGTALAPDGIVGPLTWGALDQVRPTPPGPTPPGPTPPGPTPPGPTPPGPTPPGPATPTITHTTTFAAPDGSPNTRTQVGVGEQVTFRGSATGEWTATQGIPNRLASGNTFRWTAPNRAASVTIRLRVGAQEASVTMTVIEPSSITGTKNTDLTFPAGRQGAGMTLTFNYHPMTVSFGNVQAKEVSGPATNITGYFSRYPAADLWHDSGDTFFGIRENNRDTATDTASFQGYPAPWSRGGFQWEIPNHFRVRTEGGDGKRFTTVTQAFLIEDATGRSRVTKAGQSSVRSP